jgi:beta-glucanase (GH16 family)
MAKKSTRLFWLGLAAGNIILFNNCSLSRFEAQDVLSSASLPLGSSAPLATPSPTPAPTPSPTPAPTPSQPAAIAGQGYSLSFDDEFTSLNSISLTDTFDGAKWYNGTEQCCMVDMPTDGSAALPAVNFPTVVNGTSVNPYSLAPGGGLNITLSKLDKVWYSGVLTSVDKKGNGFSQQYGYYEMKANLPPGPGTWPAFWMLSTASIKGNSVLNGEIDIMEQYGHDRTSFGITLHDWTKGTTPAQNFPLVSDQTVGYHVYGMLWTEATMKFYFDDVKVYETPTPDAMKQPYYVLINMGLGGYWPTDQTPNPSVMKIQYVRAYAK